MKKVQVEHQVLLGKLRLLSNHYRFRIVELTSRQALSITKLSSVLKLSYTKCSDYVRLLEKAGLVEKSPNGKEVLVHGRVSLSENMIRLG